MTSRSSRNGDADALAAAVTDETAAVLLEPVQGGRASSLHLPRATSRRPDAVADEHGALLWLDEVQSGMGTHPGAGSPTRNRKVGSRPTS